MPLIKIPSAMPPEVHQTPLDLWIDSSHVVAFHTSVAIPPATELFFNTPGAEEDRRPAVVAMSAIAVANLLGGFIQLSVTNKQVNDFHVRINAIFKIRARNDGKADIFLTNGQIWTIPPADLAALVQAFQPGQNNPI